MKEVVIVGALRTPIGCFQGTLARHSAVELGSMVVKALIERTGVDASAIDEVILGQVLDGWRRAESGTPVSHQRRAAYYRFRYYH
ncbi:Acetyl-CoA acetyl transferase [Salmonella enterica subsp. salamae]|nr:Acetyl-CoA acetyl transferase [Salmonella enterica subsp. salamae]